MASIKKRTDRRKKPWGVTWRNPETKKLRRKYFATKREAEAFRDTVSPSTHALHEWAVNGYLVPAFNLMAIQSFKPDRIERWQADLLGKGKPVKGTIVGGVAGLIVDARGRPLQLPQDNAKRIAKLNEWLAALGLPTAQ